MVKKSQWTNQGRRFIVLVESGNARASFCPDLGSCTIDAVANALTADLFPSDINGHFKRWYQNGKCVYENEHPDWTGFLSYPKKPDIKSVPKNSRINWRHLDFLWERTTSVGLDLPTWFAMGAEPPKNRIMIVSQDPLRRKLPGGQLHLSSPFGFHDGEYASSVTGVVLKAILQLLENNASVYLTDAMKLYFAFGNQSSCLKCRQAYLSTAFDWKASFRKVVDREIELFNPTLVVLMDNSVIEIMLDRFNSRSFNAEKIRLLTANHKPIPTEARSFEIKGRTYKFLPIWHLTSARVRLSNEQKVESFANTIRGAC